MKISVVIYAAPADQQANASALHFCRAALAAGHQIYRLFFYEQGVNTANELSVFPQDESHLSQQWQTLIKENKLDAVVCVASALKRGILNAEEARRYEKSAKTLASGFEISGLGQWVDACIHSDRVVSFGS
ncbi:sulfurtransferase complex subunit TusD [Pseudohongiella spirulinae]|uniref:Sulfurtransferase n=1 Tax=Pseudohongiella spirulinae TaxID=1249552 RepID=A0A0S2KD88_9GAMM|nr:sulfurtransferase complex subunit TusD [Pseudohongiella spirulinae]ALO46201.1 sulfurtransferase [Pseudohongiella spirulinae]